MLRVPQAAWGFALRMSKKSALTQCDAPGCLGNPKRWAPYSKLSIIVLRKRDSYLSLRVTEYFVGLPHSRSLLLCRQQSHSRLRCN